MQKIKCVLCTILLLLLILPLPSAEATDIIAFGSTASLHMNGGTGYIFNLIFSTSAGNQTIVLPGSGTVPAIYSPSGNGLAINDQLLYVDVTDSTGAKIGTILPNAIGSRSSTAVLQADGSMGANGVMVGNTGTINFWFNGFGTVDQPGASYITANKVWLNADGSIFTGTPPGLNFVLSGTPTGGASVANIPMEPGVPVLVQDGIYTVYEPPITGFQLVNITSSNMQTDLPSRTASATTSKSNYTVTFTNKSASYSGSLILEGTKTGDTAFAEGIFMFTVTDATGQIVATATNTASTATPPGEIIFTPIVYTEADVGKTFTYTVKEVATATTGSNWNIDSTEFTVLVVVTLEGNNIVATPTPSVDITFNNTTPAPPSPSAVPFTPVAQKVVIGTTVLSENQFNFVIKDTTTGNIVSTGTNAAGVANASANTSTADIIFTPIVYTDTGSYEYAIEETTPGGNGWIVLSGIPNTIDVTVTNPTGTQLVVTPEYSPDPIVITNRYVSGGVLSLGAHKTTSGGTLSSGQFQFQVYNEFNNWVASGTNDANGNVNFGTIRFSNTIPGSIGFHMYTIVESSTSGGGWTTSTVTYPVLVRVNDNGNGIMNVTAFNLNTDNFVFVNTYGASGSVVLTGTKLASGGTLTDGQFAFAVVNESGVTVATGTNNAAGNITFTPINYSSNDIGTHHYSIFETSLGINGWTPSSVVYHVSVTVIDNGDGTLTATPIYPRQGLVFINTRDSVGSIALVAAKSVVGAPMIAGQFSFAVLDENGVVVSTGTNDAAGNILFSAIPYRLDAVGTHNYTIVETTSVAPFWQTDNTVFNVTVNVVDVVAGRLNVTATYPDGGVNFTNTFTPPDRMLTITKTITGFQGFNVFDPNAISPITFLVVGTDASGAEVYRQTVAFDSSTFQWNPNFRNYTAVLHNLPAGSYRVYERGGFAPGYTNKQNPPQTANVSNTAPAAVAFTNIYTRNPVPPANHPAVTVNKVFHGITNAEIPAGFRLLLNGPGGYNSTINLSDAMSATGGLITDLAPGTYTISEQNNIVPGFINNVSINGRSVTLPYSFQITQTTGHIMITIDNNYTRPPMPSPQTGVYRNISIPILMLSFGAVIITGAEVYRRYRISK